MFRVQLSRTLSDEIAKIEENSDGISVRIMKALYERVLGVGRHSSS